MAVGSAIAKTLQAIIFRFVIISGARGAGAVGPILCQPENEGSYGSRASNPDDQEGGHCRSRATGEGLPIASAAAVTASRA